MTEIKYRGPLARKQVAALTAYLNNHGKLVKAAFEKVVFFETSIYPQVGDFVSGFSRISIREDETGITLRMKEGNPSNPKREVRAVQVKKKDAQSFLYILNHLGLKYGFYRPVQREVYKLKSFVISLKTKCVMGDHFELELPTVESINSEDVQLFLKKFKLSPWTKEQYQHRIEQKMKSSPAIDIYEANIFN